MDISSSTNLRMKIFKYKILLDLKLQETENSITVLRSNIHHNMVTTLEWIIHARAFSIRGKINGKEG